MQNLDFPNPNVWLQHPVITAKLEGRQPHPFPSLWHKFGRWNNSKIRTFKSIRSLSTFLTMSKIGNVSQLSQLHFCCYWTYKRTERVLHSSPTQMICGAIFPVQENVRSMMILVTFVTFGREGTEGETGNGGARERGESNSGQNQLKKSSFPAPISSEARSLWIFINIASYFLC